MGQTTIVPPHDYKNEVVNGRIIGDAHYNASGKYWEWDWTCEIHGTRSVNPMRIKEIVRKKPRCCYNQHGRANPNWKGFNEIPRLYINQVKRRAKIAGLEYSLTDQDLWDIWQRQNGRCVYSGRDIILGKDASLDRIDSSAGYTKNNTQWLHKDVNMAKQSMSEESFLLMCQQIVEYKCL